MSLCVVRTIRDGAPTTTTSTFTQFLSSEVTTSKAACFIPLAFDTEMET